MTRTVELTRVEIHAVADGTRVDLVSEDGEAIEVIVVGNEDHEPEDNSGQFLSEASDDGNDGGFNGHVDDGASPAFSEFLSNSGPEAHNDGQSDFDRGLASAHNEGFDFA